jgi:hypothetical protein
MLNWKFRPVRENLSFRNYEISCSFFDDEAQNVKFNITALHYIHIHLYLHLNEELRNIIGYMFIAVNRNKGKVSSCHHFNSLIQ